MHRKILVALLAAWLTTGTGRAAPSPTASPGAVKAPPAAEKKAKSPWSADVRLRMLTEDWSWFDPGVGDPSYGFLALQLRPHLKYDRPGLAGFLELQDVQLIGLPTRAIAPLPAAQMGLGATYYAHALRPSINTAGLRRAWLRLGRPDGLAFKLGRMSYSSEYEVAAADPVVDFIKKTRLKERLVGPFDFSDYARTFDGARLDYDTPRWHVTGFAAHPTQGGFEPHFATEIDRILTGQLSGTLKLPHADGELFWNRYDDTRDVPQVDNRPLPRRGRVGAQGGIHLDTYGLHYITKIGSQGDGLFWYAHQTGKWGTLTHAADALTAELGYRIPGVAWQPWLRVGYSWFSGDGNPSDRRHGTFLSPLPTVRVFARFPCYAMANVDDLYGQLIVKPSRRTVARLELHGLRLDTASDLWYAGSGATQESGGINGYLGRPSFGKTGLGTLLDLSIDHQFDERTHAQLYIGHVFGGDLIKAEFPKSAQGNWIYLDLMTTLP